MQMSIESFSIPSIILLVGLLLCAGIILLRTARKRRLHNQNHRASWLKRLQGISDYIAKPEQSSEELKNHIKNLTQDSNALLNQLGHDSSKNTH